MVLEVGWQDCQSSPTRTLYQWFCCSPPHADTSSSPRVAKHPRTAISSPPCSCSPSRTSNCLLIVFTHRNFPGFTHAVFPLRIGEWCGSVLCSEADLWVLHYDCSRTDRDTVNSSPSVVCVRFSSAASIVKNGLLSSPCMLVMYADYISELLFPPRPHVVNWCTDTFSGTV